jgi:hypothetical protein
MSDLGYLKDGLIRMRYSYDGPLKEDKGEVGKMKWGPAPPMAPRRPIKRSCPHMVPGHPGNLHRNCVPNITRQLYGC